MVVAQRLDGVLLEILRQRFQAIAEEMAQIILHTSHTVFVKQAQDMGASLATVDGELFAIPQLLGVNIITGKNMRRALAQIPSYQPGDVILTNDPYATAGMVTHLPDLFLWKPLFVDGELLCFAGTFVHSSDVGGKVPGSISPTNTEIFQEGLRLPPLKLYRAGVLNTDVRDILLANCRIPEQNWGDIQAMLAALAVGERRVQDLVGRYSVDTVRSGISGVLDYAEQQARAIIREIPDGRHVFWDYMEGDQFGWPPIRIKLTMDVRGDEIWCDFTGTEIQVRGALNLPSFNMAGHYMLTIAFVNLFRTLNRNLPSNAGVVRPIHTYSPPGTLLNPEFPAAVGVRGATMYRVIDVAMATLGMALPDVLPAAGAGMSAIILLAARDAASGALKVSVMQPLSGGGGGRPGMDGTNGTNIQGGWMRNIPNETLETEMPVLIGGYTLRPDSAGAGEFRGGWGVDFTFSVLAPSTTITARGMDRYHFPPWGKNGGQHGTTADTLVLKRGEDHAESVGKIDALELQPGDRVTFLTQGGGGLGDPLTRQPERVLADVESGLLTLELAQADYGVVLSAGRIDTAATDALRAAKRLERSDLDTYDFGPEREAYDARWTDELQSRLTELVLLQPASWRAYFRERLVAEIEQRQSTGRRVVGDDLPAIFDDVRTRATAMTIAALIQEATR